MTFLLILSEKGHVNVHFTKTKMHSFSFLKSMHLLKDPILLARKKNRISVFAFFEKLRPLGLLVSRFTKFQLCSKLQN
jgi:hypothetical protein